MKFILFLAILMPIKAWGAAGESVYKTPSKVQNRAQNAGVLFSSPEVQKIMSEVSLLAGTPEGGNSEKHARSLIDAQETEPEKAAARMRRHLKRKYEESPSKIASPIKKAWIKKYQQIMSNNTRGNEAEKCALDGFGVEDNNKGQPVLLSQVLPAAREGEPDVLQVTRPDGVAEDADGSPVVFESKLLSGKRRVLYASRQLRAQEQSARENNWRHVIVITTDHGAEETENFPVPSSTFRAKELLSEFRLIDGEGNVYRWDPESEFWEMVD